MAKLPIRLTVTLHYYGVISSRPPQATVKAIARITESRVIFGPDSRVGEVEQRGNSKIQFPGGMTFDRITGSPIPQRRWAGWRISGDDKERCAFCVIEPPKED
jgi:hypothetical protein